MCSLLGMFLVVALTAGSVWAETIELVTYYPAPQTADMHTRSLTVGTPYANELLLDGQVIIYSWVGIGDGFFTAANRPAEVIPAVPTEPLEVQGNILSRAPAAKDSLFISDRAAANRLNGLRLRTNDASQWTIGSRNDGTENLHIFSDASATPVTRFFIEQGTGNVGIGTTAPTGRLHVVGTDDVVSNVLFMPGADTVANPATPRIRVGIGTGFTAANPPASTLQVEGSLGMNVTVVAGNVTLNEAQNVVLCNNGGAMTINLPAAAQCAGRTYTIKKISNNTLEVVIDPNGAEGIDGRLTLSLYVQNDAVRIVSDGANWDVISDELRPHQAKMTREAPQSVPNIALTKILFDNLEFNMGGMADAANSRFVIRRAGRYLITAYIRFDLGGNYNWGVIYKNGSPFSGGTVATASAPGDKGMLAVDVLDLVPNDYIEWYVIQDTGANRNTSGSPLKPRMSVTELRY